MSKNGTSKVVRYSRENLPPDKTNWARIDAMTDEEVVAAALSDPDAQPLTPEQWAMRRVSRVRNERSWRSSAMGRGRRIIAATRWRLCTRPRSVSPRRVSWTSGR